MTRTLILIFGFFIEFCLSQAIQIASYKDMIWLCYLLLFVMAFVCGYWWYNFWLCVRFNKWKEKV